MFFMVKWYYVITILSPPVSGPDQPQAGLRQGGHLTHRHEPFHTVYEVRKLRYIKQLCTACPFLGFPEKLYSTANPVAPQS